MTYPIPVAALDDRLAWVGTSGSGKTYNSSAGVEHLLAKKHRTVISDPLDVWWGLRLCQDGKTPSPFEVVIFGGKHGDLPINRHAGGIIGETVATMRESCIVSLGTLGSKRDERLFMLDFLESLYKHTDPAKVEPYHVIFDEADYWAPQKPIEDEHKKLQSRMEEIVRRGRVRGFIPWLITQRPAVLSKDVLSQADGLISFKLTSSQDRDAIGAWVEGQADREEWKAMRAELATLERGTGVVWLPGRGILKTAQFPEKSTFDSSRTPKRGERRETRELKPLDVDALKGKLATVEEEAKANDPKALKADLAKVNAELARLRKSAGPAPVATGQSDIAARKREREMVSTIEELRKALEAAMKFIVEINASNFFKAGGEKIDKAAIEKVIADATDRATKLIESTLERRNKELSSLQRAGESLHKRIRALLNEDVSIKVDVHHNEPFVNSPAPAARVVTQSAPRAPRTNGGDGGTLKPALQRALDAIAWWRKIGFDPIERDRAAVVAGYSPKASTFGVYIGELVQLGLVETSPGKVALTDVGLQVAHTPEAATEEELRAHARGLLKPQEQRVFDVIYAAWPTEIARDKVAESVGLSPIASTCGVYIGGVAAYGIVEPGSRGHVRAADWLFPESR